MNNHSMPEDEFIELVHQEKALWDPNHQHYKDVETKTKIWRTLAEKCNSNEMDVKRRWTGLREKYRRERIYNAKLRRDGSGSELQRWTSFDKMTFLDRVYIPRGSYRIYRDGMEMNSAISSGYFPGAKHVKLEENSSDDYNINDYLETSVNSESPDTHHMEVYASSSTSGIDQVPNDNQTFFGGLSKKQIQTLQSQQVWINATARNSSNTRDGESSSPCLSHRSDLNIKPSHLDYRPNDSTNRYQAFGLYIADMLDRMDDRYANELHISILQEIIKVQTKISHAHDL